MLCSAPSLPQELRTHRAELAKTKLLQRELEALTSRTQGLSEEVSIPTPRGNRVTNHLLIWLQLQEALDLIISPYYRSLSDDDKVLLQEEFEDLEDNLPLIGHHISMSLHKSTLEIARIAYPLGSLSAAMIPMALLISHREHASAGTEDGLHSCRNCAPIQCPPKSPGNALQETARLYCTVLPNT